MIESIQNNNVQQPILTVIVAVKITEGRSDLIERIDFCMADSELPENVEFLIIDDGSRDEDFIRLLKKANTLRTIVRTGACYYDDFSLARARNYGAKIAHGQFILFMDADLVPYPGFYKALLREIELMEMSTRVDRFLMCPVIYLTEQGKDKFFELREDIRRQFFINAMLRLDDNIEKYSSGTSVILVDRTYYLARGGQDEKFRGWGYEDYEFTNRLIRRNRQFPLPANWLSMAGNFMTITKYEGWKAIYRLYGDWLGNKGIYLFHIPHVIEENHHRRKDANFSYLQARMKEDGKNGLNEPDPLPDASAGHSLLFRKNPFCYSREFAPSLGQITYANEDDFSDIQYFKEYLAQHAITRVIFPNPYASTNLNQLYIWCRENSFDYVVCERGALPDSVFHDPTGFLNDGISYAQSKWNKPLTEEQLYAVRNYVSSIRYGSSTLEAQSDRCHFHEILESLEIKRHQKVLLVPFQQPNDTVIQHFAGQIGSFDAFHRKIALLVDELGADWKVVYKKHPTEDDIAPIAGAVSGSNFNIYDLLEICDAVALINSGVGIYAMMFGKPVYVLGDAWYSHHDLCRPINTDDNLSELIKNEFKPDYDIVLRFIYYLRFEFYSFGKMTQRRVRYPNGSPMTATSKIDYYEVRGWSHDTRYIPVAWEPIQKLSPLFDRYRHAFGTNPVAKSGAPTPTSNSVAKSGTPAPTSNSLAKSAISTVAIGHLSVEQRKEDISQIKNKTSYRVFGAITAPFMKQQLRNKFENRPHEFFQDSKSFGTRIFGKLILPKISEHSDRK